MIKINPIDGNYYFGITVEGHADYAPHGQDIVCASVTTAYLLLKEMLTKATHEDQILIEEHGDYYSVKVYESSSEIVNIIGVFYSFLKSVAEQYPKNVQMEEWE